MVTASKLKRMSHSNLIMSTRNKFTINSHSPTLLTLTLRKNNNNNNNDDDDDDDDDNNNNNDLT